MDLVRISILYNNVSWLNIRLKKYMSMITSIIKSAVGDKDIGWSSLLLTSTLLRTDHYQGKLSCWLPNLILLSYFLSIGGQIAISLVILGFRLLDIVNLVSIVMGTTIDIAVSLFLLLSNGSIRHDIKASLSLRDELSILMLFKTQILLFDLFLSRLMTFIHRFRMNPIESLGRQHFI